MSRYQVVGELRVQFNNEVEADSAEEAEQYVHELNPVADLDWVDEYVEVDDVVKLDD